jgi:hypothetical protein
MPVAAFQKFNYRTWDDFKSKLQGDLSEGAGANDSTFIFRGQGNDEWPLKTSFAREFNIAEATTRSDLQDALKACFKEQMRLAEGDEDNATWSHGQHHGLPTPLLDWTLSPYVAAFFAAESALRWMLEKMETGDIAPDRKFVVIALRQKGARAEAHWEAMGVTFKNDWSSGNERIRSQRGVLSKVPAIYRTLEECVEFYTGTGRYTVENWLLKTFAVPYSAVLEALKDLERMDINFRRLYGGIEGICKSARVQTQLSYFEHHLLR